jgi:hypothetical protein
MVTMGSVCTAAAVARSDEEFEAGLPVCCALTGVINELSPPPQATSARTSANPNSDLPPLFSTIVVSMV